MFIYPLSLEWVQSKEHEWMSGGGGQLQTPKLENSMEHVGLDVPGLDQSLDQPGTFQPIDWSDCSYPMSFFFVFRLSFTVYKN